MKVGIFGAGQLGLMLAQAASKLGVECVLYDSNPASPASKQAEFICADFSDLQKIQEFVKRVDCITFEFENIPSDVLSTIKKPVHPAPMVLAMTQDRIKEKQLFNQLAIPTAKWAMVTDYRSLQSGISEIGASAVLKTSRFGYDGKGQWRINPQTNLEALWGETAGVECILEEFISFKRELSVIAVRAQDGAFAIYPLVENHHRQGILRYSIAPAAKIEASILKSAEHYARSLAEHFSYVGVFALELFETDAGLLANEIAPRVHNSGHWTIEGASASQFENHIRAVCGLPLGSTNPKQVSLMINLIGDIPNQSLLNSDPQSVVHLYGKEPRPGRKIGHITWVLPSYEQAQVVLKSNLLALAALSQN